MQETENVAAFQVQSSPAQAQGPWMNYPAGTNSFGNYQAQATKLAATAPVADATIIPFALQGIAQYSPLLGDSNSAFLDAPAPTPTSELRPLAIDYPQIIETATGKELVHTLPAQMPAVQEIPLTPPTLAATYQEPQSDPFLEAMMRQAQMGIFALPGKDT
jgi:hypothetical protein